VVVSACFVLYKHTICFFFLFERSELIEEKKNTKVQTSKRFEKKKQNKFYFRANQFPYVNRALISSIEIEH